MESDHIVQAQATSLWGGHSMRGFTASSWWRGKTVGVWVIWTSLIWLFVSGKEAAQAQTKPGFGPVASTVATPAVAPTTPAPPASGQTQRPGTSTSAPQEDKTSSNLITNQEPAPCPLPSPCPAAAPVAPMPDLPSIGYDRGFYVRSKDKNYSIVINGFVQVIYRLTASEGQDINHTFHLSFGGLGFSGNVFSQNLRYTFLIIGSTYAENSQISMYDWNIKYTFGPYLSIQAGRFLAPFSRGFSTPPLFLLLPDYSAAEYAFHFNRAIGVHFQGTLGRLGYDAFVSNSIRTLAVDTQANRGDQLAGGGRLELAILAPFGYMETLPQASSGPAQLSVGAGLIYNPVADDLFFLNTQKGDNTLTFTADAGLRWQRLTLQGAFFLRHFTNHDLPQDYGFYGQGGLYIVRGRLELAGRVGGTRLSDRTVVAGLNNLLPGSVMEYTGGLNAYLFGHGTKLQTDYTFLANDNFNGTSTQGHRWRVQLQLLF